MVETPGKITLWQIEIFVAVSDAHSISAAAERLGASPSAVSQQLSNLEQALGSELLNRNARPVSLTPAGEMFAQRAERILREAEQAAQELAQGEMAARVRLRLGVIEDFDAEVTPGLLTGLADAMSGTRFLLETGASHRLIAHLDARSLDIVIAAEPAELTQAHQTWPLLRDPFVLVLPKALGETDPAETLRRLPMIGYTSRHVMGRQITSYLARQGVEPRQQVELDSYHAIMAMVARGGGWSILTPLGVMRAQRFFGEVALLPLPFGALARRISLLIRGGEDAGIAEEVLGLVRPLIQNEVLAFCQTHIPWLDQEMRLL